MQNSLNKEGTVVEFTSKTAADAKKGVSAPSELVSQVSKFNILISFIQYLWIIFLILISIL